VPVNLAPVTTSSRVQTAESRIFCPDQGQSSSQAGCFQNGINCKRIEVAGAPAGPLALNTPKPVTLASIFCVAATTNAVVNFSANLPGPGATVLVGNLTARP
jgi:hypothetical protein